VGHGTNEPRFFFVHLQKTAGTSLSRQLKRCFDRAAIYPDPSDGDIVAAVIDVDHLVARWNARRDEIRLVSGHFPLCTAELLDARFSTFTILRDPVDRTLSYLRHHKKLTPEDHDRSLEEIYEDPFRFHGLIHNHMVKMFSLTVDEMSAGLLTQVEFTPERLERAKANLSGVDVVGVSEQLPQLCGELERCFGWDLGDAVHINRTEPVAAPDGLRARIENDNALDIELYEFARTLVSSGGG
jgi:hypothetical protein